MMKVEKAAIFEKTLESVRSKMDKIAARRLDFLKENDTGTWLVAIPNKACGTVLSTVEFRDELCDRYGLDILNASSHCDGCNSKFSTVHALGCKVGGLIHSRHDESRDSLVFLACVRFQPSNVRYELHINSFSDNRGKDDSNRLTKSQTGVQCEINGDRGDLLIRGFWERNTDCIIDVRICDVNQASYLTRKPASIVKCAENAKKKHYLNDCLDQRRHLLLLSYFVKVCLEKSGRIFETYCDENR